MTIIVEVEDEEEIHERGWKMLDFGYMIND